MILSITENMTTIEENLIIKILSGVVIEEVAAETTIVVAVLFVVELFMILLIVAPPQIEVEEEILGVLFVVQTEVTIEMGIQEDLMKT